MAIVPKTIGRVVIRPYLKLDAVMKRMKGPLDNKEQPDTLIPIFLN
jgi:hypothetical protein